MTETKDLKPGCFYWVWPVLDPDTDEEWENRPQPARYAGMGEGGVLLWNYLGIGETADWPVRWIGEEIMPPGE